MDLQTLKYFCAVAAEGSLSKAAQKLHYAQSNLSTKIMQLEQDMGTTLFYRNSHGVSLTPKGETLLKYATNLINLAEEVTIVMKDDGLAKGTLKIGSMESTVISYLSKFLATFHEEKPEIAVKIETGTTDALLEKVLEHKLDGAFVAGPIKHSELFTKQVKSEKLCIIASRKLLKRPDLDAALKEPLLVFPSGCSYRKILENLMQKKGFVINKIYEFTTLSAIFASVTAGLGIALFPESAIKQYTEASSLTITKLPEKQGTVSTVFVYRKDSYLSSAMCNFINSIK